MPGAVPLQGGRGVPEPGNPQALNRYSYTYNNPLKYLDPSGHDPCTGNPRTFMPDCGLQDEEVPYIPGYHWEVLLKGAKFTFSYYVFASEADALVYGVRKGLPHVGETTTLTLGGQEYTFQSRFLYGYEGVANQGTGYSQANDIWIHYTGGGNGWNERAEYLNNPETAGFALGKGKDLTPYIHVAADQSVAPIGSLLYAPGLSKTPSGGLVTVKDAGGKIVGPILDQFVGFGLNAGYQFKNTYERLPSPVYIAVRDEPLTVNPSEFSSRTMK